MVRAQEHLLAVREEFTRVLSAELPLHLSAETNNTKGLVLATAP
jgi:hypothetical protein